MRANRMNLMLAVVFLAVAGAQARAGIIYSESTGGDFSDDRLAPSALTLGLGSNLISGSFGPRSETDHRLDLDYVTVTVPAGAEWTGLYVGSANVGGAFSFLGLEAGSRVSVPYTTVSAATLLGWSHFGSASVGSDLFPEMRVASGAIGFTGSLPAGQYTLWLMELNTDEPRGYGLDLQLSAVVIPEPAALGLAMPAAVLLGRRRR